MQVCEARRLRHLEEENRKLKHLAAELTLDDRALQENVGKSGDPSGPARRRRTPPGALRAQRAALVPLGELVALSRTYQHHGGDNLVLRGRLLELSAR